MNPDAIRTALIFAAIGGVAFIAFLVLVAGCRSSLPEETGWVEVTSRVPHDAALGPLR